MLRRTKIEPKQLAHIRRALLPWYDAHHRDLPWRRSSDPYAIWLSETMLQQTQVATVIPYFQKFMTRFPTVSDLAAADLDEVLQMWAGLGYYARARNLHAAAKMIVEEFGGRVPATMTDLQKLPGVGAYTAGAVASIAHGKKAVVVDGNVARVLARLFDIHEDVRYGAARDLVTNIAEQLLPNDRCGDHNQALMELGATICQPGAAAQCLLCPLRKHCEACAQGTVSSLPVKTKKTAVKMETHVVAAIQNEDRWLVVQRPRDGLWGGLWELPSAVAHDDSLVKLAGDIATKYAAAPFIADKVPFCQIQRQLTHRTIAFVGHILRPKPKAAKRSSTRNSPTEPTAQPTRWLKLEEISAIGMSTAMRKVVDSLHDHLTTLSK